MAFRLVRASTSTARSISSIPSSLLRLAPSSPASIAITTSNSTLHHAATFATAATGKETPFTEPAGGNPALDYSAQSAALQEFGSYLMASLPKFVQQTSVYKDELTLYVAPSAIKTTLEFLRDHSNTQYKSIIDICGVDFPTKSNRFEVVYHLVSVKHNSRIRVKTYADEVSPVPSVVGLFMGADWFVQLYTFKFLSQVLFANTTALLLFYLLRLIGMKEKLGICLEFSSLVTQISVEFSPITDSKVTLFVKTSLLPLVFLSFTLYPPRQDF